MEGAGEYGIGIHLEMKAVVRRLSIATLVRMMSPQSQRRFLRSTMIPELKRYLPHSSSDAQAHLP